VQKPQTASRGKHEISSRTILLCAPRISVFYEFREPYAIEWILQMPVTVSIRFRTGCIEKRDTQVGRHRTCEEEIGIVPASTWLETFELSLSREWRPRTTHTYIPQRKFCDGYSINCKPVRMPLPSISDLSNSIHMFFEWLSHSFSSILSFSSPPPYHTVESISLLFLAFVYSKT